MLARICFLYALIAICGTHTCIHGWKPTVGQASGKFTVTGEPGECPELQCPSEFPCQLKPLISTDLKETPDSYVALSIGYDIDEVISVNEGKKSTVMCSADDQVGRVLSGVCGGTKVIMSDAVCLRNTMLTDEKLSIFRRMLQEAKAFFRKTYQVLDLNKPLPYKYSHSVTPEPPHIVFEVTLCSLNQSADYVNAVALTTILEALPSPITGATGRVVKSSINIAPEYIKNDEVSIRSMIGTLIHEMTHGLGFSNSAFGCFPKPKSLKQNVTKCEYNSKLKKTVTKVVTPKVVKAAQEHYGCPTLDGVELEDATCSAQSSLSQYSHWEKRITMDETMSPSRTDYKMSYSSLTLALMEDSGWYKVNYSNADPLEWGKGLGCDFVEKPCVEQVEGKWSRSTAWPPQYLCNVFQGTGCFLEGTKAECSLTPRSEFEQLPKYALAIRLGEGEKYVGEKFSDFCPIYKPMGSESCSGERSSRQGADKTNEEYGATSRCFEGNLVGKDWQPMPSLPTCHIVECLNAKTPAVKLAKDYFPLWEGPDTLYEFYSLQSQEQMERPQIGGQPERIYNTDFNGIFYYKSSMSNMCKARKPRVWPVIQSMTPMKGDYLGGSVVTVYGVNFDQSCSVVVGSLKAKTLSITINGPDVLSEIVAVTAEWPLKKLEDGVGVGGPADGVGNVTVSVRCSRGRSFAIPNYFELIDTGDVYSIIYHPLHFMISLYGLIAGVALVLIIGICLVGLLLPSRKGRRRLQPPQNERELTVPLSSRMHDVEEQPLPLPSHSQSSQTPRGIVQDVVAQDNL